MKKLALLVVPALLLQIIATTQLDTGHLSLKRALLLVSYALLIVGVLGMRGRATRALALAGILLNTIAIVANGGLMPTAPDAVYEATGVRPELHTSRQGSKDIVLPRSEIRLYGLSDHIVVKRIHNVLSPGDFVLFAALITYVAGGFVALFRKAAPALDEAPPITALLL